jgi:hypothetical protein
MTRSILLAILVAVGLTACGGKEVVKATSQPQPAQIKIDQCTGDITTGFKCGGAIAK